MCLYVRSCAYIVVKLTSCSGSNQEMIYSVRQFNVVFRLKYVTQHYPFPNVQTEVPRDISNTISFFLKGETGIPMKDA